MEAADAGEDHADTKYGEDGEEDHNRDGYYPDKRGERGGLSDIGQVGRGAERGFEGEWGCFSSFKSD